MMNSVANLLRRLGRDRRGTAVIETAIVAPILGMLAIGGFEASAMVARQTELQSAVAEAAAIVQAAPPNSMQERTTIAGVLRASTGVGENDASVIEIYRCGTGEDYETNKNACLSSDVVSTYIRITLTDTYTPSWTSFGIGDGIDYNVQRTVQIS